MAANYTLDILQGSDFPLRILLRNEDDTPFDLTDYNVRGSIRYKYFNSDVVLDLQPAITSIPSGQIDFQVPGTGTTGIAPTRYVYDMEIYNSTGNVTRILMGRVEIFSEVTY